MPLPGKCMTPLGTISSISSLRLKGAERSEIAAALRPHDQQTVSRRSSSSIQSGLCPTALITMPQLQINIHLGLIGER